ncbi:MULTISPECIES: lasso peptide isopeptide bond-forming cyclase [Methanobacterium]|uniref:Putative asparagine synthetase [glutamine-hydrolyzing] n=1 Tax=Methanobacterium veterum TaxID=408577 RepID=A0A9E5DIL1_9EURY|nr:MULTISPECIES: lasso peptide isopeptide bond-forming cyclase [Methanobacterium]MCZ3364273.1 lasso peptide isopeptide bond-forming cyclase [Methanobacterium veterum]MCZ3372020.1 lasso peptide isopeptide bond-forming cyclase [Methanobacterium veterum]
MSAITGIFYRDGRKIDPELIKNMNARLSHRGPDGSAVWCEGSVALGHQMLWTTPESLHEKLPFEDDESGLVITADARIDNRDELSKELDIEDKEEVSDSYFILKAYSMWGEDCPDKLLGDFAFAIWDKNEEKLFCARDHMGVKPFYYYLDDDMFVFGTEIKALFCVPGVPRELNEKKVALFLMRDSQDQELTFYENVKSLPSAHSFTLNKYKIVKEKYWKLDPNLNLIMDSEEEYAKTFRDIFAEAVRCRLRSHFPLGFELSGGLDSSSIVCITKKILSENEDINLKINTFSQIFDETPESDERFFIKKVIDKHEIKANFVNVDFISPLEDIKTVLWYQDQPFYTPHITKLVKFYQKINEESIKIVLSGQGGDQIVSHGNNYLRELALTFSWKELIKEINGRSSNSHENKFKILLEKIIFPSVPYDLKKLIKLFLRKNEDLFINEDYLKSLGIDNVDYNESLKQFSSKKYHYHAINDAYDKTVFETTDRLVACSDIELRYPFYDKRLIEFCYALPTEMKLKCGWSRYILRIAMEDILPTEIQWRYNKTDLRPTYEKNFLLFEKSTLKKIIYDDNSIIKSYVNLKELQNIFERYNGNNHDLFEIWLVVLLYLWFLLQQKYLIN